jgi:hypothetical protein
VRDASGHGSPASAPSWSGSDSTVALVTATGLVSALRPGTVRITAREGTLSATLDLTVRPLTVQSVQVLGLPDTVCAGDVMPFGVRITGEGGRTVTGRAVTLASADPSVALIDPSRRLRGSAQGAPR